MRVLGDAPQVVGRLKGQQGDGQGGLDVGDGTGLFEQFDDDAVVLDGIQGIAGIANGQVKATDGDAVLEGDGDASERTGEVDLSVVDPLFSGWQEELGDAVGTSMGDGGGLAIGSQDIERGDGGVVDLLDQGRDGSGKDGALLSGQRTGIGGRERGEAGGSFGLLEGTGEEGLIVRIRGG